MFLKSFEQIERKDLRIDSDEELNEECWIQFDKTDSGLPQTALQLECYISRKYDFGMPLHEGSSDTSEKNSL